MTRTGNFQFPYLPNGWQIKDFHRFIKTEAGRFWMNYKMQKDTSFKIPSDLKVVQPVFKASGFEGQVVYNVFKDGSFCMLSNGVDEVYYDYHDFILENNISLSKDSHDISLVEYYVSEMTNGG